jgi:hypothetical protein
MAGKKSGVTEMEGLTTGLCYRLTPPAGKKPQAEKRAETPNGGPRWRLVRPSGTCYHRHAARNPKPEIQNEFSTPEPQSM